MALFTVAVVLVASWSLANQGRADAARTKQSRISAIDGASTIKSSPPASGGGTVATQQGQDEAIKLHTGGAIFTLEPALAPPLVSQQAAIDTARARMDGGGTVIQSEPRAEH